MVESTLHALKGVTGNFGARHVSDLCESLRGRVMKESEWKVALHELESELNDVFALLEAKCP